MSASFWQVGAWYSHALYPKRRIQITAVDGGSAQGIIYRNGSAVWHPIGLDYADIKHCSRLEDK